MDRLLTRRCIGQRLHPNLCPISYCMLLANANVLADVHRIKRTLPPVPHAGWLHGILLTATTHDRILDARTSRTDCLLLGSSLCLFGYANAEHDYMHVVVVFKHSHIYSSFLLVLLFVSVHPKLCFGGAARRPGGQVVSSQVTACWIYGSLSMLLCRWSEAGRQTRQCGRVGLRRARQLAAITGMPSPSPSPISLLTNLHTRPPVQQKRLTATASGSKQSVLRAMQEKKSADQASSTSHMCQA